MKVILVTPSYHQMRGNTVTVERISEGLRSLGISTEIVSSEEAHQPPLGPLDLFHGFNAYQFSKYWKRWGSSAYPYLVTLTGTDLNYFLFHKQTRDEVVQSLKGAQAIHVFNKEARNILWQEVAGLEDKTFLIPQGLTAFPLAESKVNKAEGSFIFLLPAGIRRIKNIPAAITLLTTIYERNPGIQLWIVGPIIEEDEGSKVLALVEQNNSWIRYLGQVPHQEMGRIYQSADVVLNISLSEGQSSAILEAMSMGIPVVASDVAGNRDIVFHGQTGFLYGDEYEFSHYVQLLMQNGDLRKKMGLAGKEYVKNHHSVDQEVRALAAIYSGMLQNK